MSRYSAQTKAHIHRSTCHISARRALQHVDFLGCFGYPKSFVKVFFPLPQVFFLPLLSHRHIKHMLAEDITKIYLYTHTPSRLEREPGGVSSVSAQRAEGPHDEFEAGVVNVPKVDVFMGDLHGALPIDVQVRGGH